MKVSFISSSCQSAQFLDKGLMDFRHTAAMICPQFSCNWHSKGGGLSVMSYMQASEVTANTEICTLVGPSSLQAHHIADITELFYLQIVV